MANPLIVTVTLAGANDSIVAASQTPGAAGNLNLVGGGTVTLDTQRRILVTTAGNDSAKTLTIYGTNLAGSPISESMTGAQLSTATTATNLDFYTVTRVAVSAAFAAAVKVGTNGVGSTQWYSINRELTPVNIGFAVHVTGTVNYSVQLTYDDPNAVQGVNGGTVEPASNVPPLAWSSITALAAKAADAEGQLTWPAFAYRLLINSGTGSASLQAIQAGIRGN